MSTHLTLALDRAEGALLRVLGTIERRGWSVLELTVASITAERYTIELDLSGPRDAQVLCRQLERLVEVHEVVLRELAGRDETGLRLAAAGRGA